MAVYFVNTNPSEERVQVLLSRKELGKLPDDSPDIKKSNTDRFIERPTATFCNAKIQCFRQFLLCRS